MINGWKSKGTLILLEKRWMKMNTDNIKGKFNLQSMIF